VTRSDSIRELGVVPVGVDQAHAEVLVRGLDGDADIGHEPAEKGDVAWRVVHALMSHQLTMVVERSAGGEQLQGGAKVAVEQSEVLRASSGQVLSEVALAVLGAVFGADGELGEVVVAAGAAVLEPVEQRALQARPASVRVVEVVRFEDGEVGGRWSTDKAQAVGKEKLLER
jgi:N-acetylglutamate synthase/N-acetylornithine aminotransferase